MEAESQLSDIICYMCGKQYGLSHYAQHEAQCAQATLSKYHNQDIITAKPIGHNSITAGNPTPEQIVAYNMKAYETFFHLFTRFSKKSVSVIESIPESTPEHSSVLCSFW